MKTGDLAELPAHLFDDLAARAAHGLHGERGEDEGERGAEEEAREVGCWRGRRSREPRAGEAVGVVANSATAARPADAMA